MILTKERNKDKHLDANTERKCGKISLPDSIVGACQTILHAICFTYTLAVRVLPWFSFGRVTSLLLLASVGSVLQVVAIGLVLVPRI